jgi:hypothetical protein
VSRSPADIAEEEALFLELKRLEQQERQFRKDRDGLLRTIMGIESGLPEIGVEEQEALALQAPAGFDRKRRRHEDSPATPQTAGTLPFSSTSAAGPSASAGTRRTAQNIEDDARQCITRASPPPSAMAAGMSIKTGTHQPVYLRAFKLPVPKPVIAGKIVQALVEMGVPMINEATMLPEPAAASLGKVGDGVGEGASLRSKQHLQALGGVLGVPSPDSKRGRQLLLRLVMPTRANCVKLERLIDSVGLLMETKMAVDRIEQEIRVAEQRLKMRREGPGTGAPSEQAMEVDEDEGDSVSVAGGREMSVVSNTAEAVRGRPGRRQRSVSSFLICIQEDHPLSRFLSQGDQSLSQALTLLRRVQQDAGIESDIMVLRGYFCKLQHATLLGVYAWRSGGITSSFVRSFKALGLVQ